MGERKRKFHFIVISSQQYNVASNMLPPKATMSRLSECLKHPHWLWYPFIYSVTTKVSHFLIKISWMDRELCFWVQCHGKKNHNQEWKLQILTEYKLKVKSVHCGHYLLHYNNIFFVSHWINQALYFPWVQQVHELSTASVL